MINVNTAHGHIEIPDTLAEAIRIEATWLDSYSTAVLKEAELRQAILLRASLMAAREAEMIIRVNETLASTPRGGNEALRAALVLAGLAEDDLDGDDEARTPNCDLRQHQLSDEHALLLARARVTGTEAGWRAAHGWTAALGAKGGE